MSGAAPITSAAELLSELWAPLVLIFIRRSCCGDRQTGRRLQRGPGTRGVRDARELLPSGIQGTSGRSVEGPPTTMSASCGGREPSVAGTLDPMCERNADEVGSVILAKTGPRPVVE